MAPKTTKPRKHLLSDTWTVEIGALLLSLSATVVIIVLLSVYDGHPQFQWHGVTLNAVIAVLAACVRAGFMVPVEESLSQWKWLWFVGKTRHLADFESIDDASRGSRGSLILLWETKSWYESLYIPEVIADCSYCRSITAIGAWIVLISIATEPFIQQMVSFKEAVTYQTDSSVQIPFAERWSAATEIQNVPNFGTSNPTGGLLALHSPASSL